MAYLEKYLRRIFSQFTSTYFDLVHLCDESQRCSGRSRLYSYYQMSQTYWIKSDTYSVGAEYINALWTRQRPKGAFWSRPDIKRRRYDSVESTQENMKLNHAVWRSALSAKNPVTKIMKQPISPINCSAIYARSSELLGVSIGSSFPSSRYPWVFLLGFLKRI